MEANLWIYSTAIATASGAAMMIGGPAWAIPPLIGVLASSPESQEKVAANWATSAQHLEKLNTALEKAGKAASPEEWSAKDREEFDKSVMDLMKQVTQAKAGVEGAGQTIQLSSTASKVCGYFCLTSSSILLALALAPLYLPAFKAGAWVMSSRIYAAMSSVLGKQRMLALSAGGVVAAVAVLQTYQTIGISDKVKNPESGAPQFTKVKMDWAEEKKA